jgi:hypothetical protein
MHDDNEFKRVAQILAGIRETLEKFQGLKPKPIDSMLTEKFDVVWPEVDKTLQTAIGLLENSSTQETYRKVLAQSGFTGEMLALKEASAKYHTDRLKKAILTYRPERSMLDQFVEWIRPGFKVINSILESLKEIPGLDFVKEFKDHLEAAYDAAEAGEIKR